MLELQAPILNLLKSRSMGAQTDTLVQLLRGTRPNVVEHQVRKALCDLHSGGKVTRDRRHGSSWRVAV